MDDQRGILYPERLPEFHRLAPSENLAHAVTWFWVPEWNLPDGTESVQEILPFPACNIVVDPTGVSAVGPPTTRSQRVLTGHGWAVGALLRPAAAHALIADLEQLRDTERPLDAPELHSRVLHIMQGGEATSTKPAGTAAAIRRQRAVDAVSGWILDRVPRPAEGSDAALANALAGVIMSEDVRQVSDLSPRLHTSTRTLQRLAVRYFGLSLHSMIRRRRLQEAAARLRADDSVSIASIASDLGYADQAHFATDFKAVLGVTPRDYRSGV